MAAKSLSRECQRPVVRHRGPSHECKRPAHMTNGRPRPLAVTPSARKSLRQRPLSKYSRHRPTAARRCLRSKAVAQSLAPLMIGIRRRAYVRSSTKRTGTDDPLLPMGVLGINDRSAQVAGGRGALKAAGSRTRRPLKCLAEAGNRSRPNRLLPGRQYAPL